MYDVMVWECPEKCGYFSVIGIYHHRGSKRMYGRTALNHLEEHKDKLWLVNNG